jgi:type I restriction enzyme, S subunit
MNEFHQPISLINDARREPNTFDSANSQKTEIGLIPKDWELVDLGDISIISRLAGAEYTSVWRESPSGEIIALRGFNIEQNKINLRDVVRISDKLSRKLKRSRLTKGDVVYPCVGTIGNAAVIYEDDTYHIQQNIARITPDKTRVQSEFLSHYLTSSIADKEVEKFNATSSQPNVLVGSLRQYKVPLPKTQKEQTAIANALSDVDALIQELEKLIAKKQAIKTATMQQLLTGRTRLPQFAHHPDGRKKGYKPSELGEIPEDWEVVRLGDVGETIIGLTYSPNDVAEFGTLVLRSSNVQQGKLAYSDCVYVDMPLPERVIVREGDILVCVRNGSRQLIGKCALIDKKAEGHAFGAFMSIYRTQHSKFVFYQFQSDLIQSQINEMMGATINQITNKDMASFVIGLPCDTQEQTAIAQICSDIDEEIQALEQRLNKTRQIKQGMMQELLTGKTRLIKGGAHD